MTNTLQEFPRYLRPGDEKSFFFDFVMFVKQEQENGGTKYYDELLNLFLDAKGDRTKQLSMRVVEISKILNIPNPFNID